MLEVVMLNPKCQSCGTSWRGMMMLIPVSGKEGRLQARKHCPSCHEQQISEEFEDFRDRSEWGMMSPTIIEPKYVESVTKAEQPAI